jgi:ubiquinone/menaquinone biosynthesis C-methylase UbiE
MPELISEVPPNPAPFDAVAPVYDRSFTFSRIGCAQRKITRRELNRIFRPGQRILELNCGTGVDAIDLASRGIEVLACDISPRMIDQAGKKLAEARQQSQLQAGVTFRVLATEHLGALREASRKAKFDGAFSNFAGLNCVENLSKVARDLGKLLHPGAPLLLCLFGRFCAWEVVWYLAHRSPAKALRRLRRGAARARLTADIAVSVYYPSVREVTRIFAPEFVLKRWRGVGVAIPPTYLEKFARRFPNLLSGCTRLDRWIGLCPVFRSMADHVLTIFERAS